MTKHLTSLLLTVGLGAGFSLTSCVDPYHATTTHTHTIGHRIDTLPKGYRTEILGGTTYYYHDGYYYRPHNGAYVVAEAPRGSRYSKHHSRHWHNRDMRGDSRRGDVDPDVRIITRLPRDTRVINHKGIRYYQHQNQYYRRQGNGFITIAAPF